jgi:hypothetical protein
MAVAAEFCAAPAETVKANSSTGPARRRLNLLFLPPAKSQTIAMAAR